MDKNVTGQHCLNTENREVCVMRCFLQDRCIWASGLHTSLEENAFVTTEYILDTENLFVDTEDVLRYSNFIVVVVCRHLEQNLRKIRRFIHDFSAKVIISGDLNGRHTRQIFHDFKLFKTSEVSEISSHIRHTLDENETTVTSIPTEDYDQAISKIRSSSNSLFFRQIMDENQIQQASVPPTDYEYDRATSTVRGSSSLGKRNRCQATGFVKAHSLEPSKESAGTFIYAGECFPTVLVRTESVDHLKRRFYTVNGKEKTDLIKQIQNVTIGSLRANSDFLGLITLLGIADYNIQEIIIALLNLLQLQDDIMNRCLRGSHLFMAVKWLVGIVKSNYGDSHIVTNTLPVTCDSVAMLYLSTLTITELSDQMKSDIETFCFEECLSVRHIASTNVGNSKDILTCLTATLHLLLTELKSRVGISNSLKIGNLKDALMIADNRSRLLEHFRHSMCFLEQYTCLFFVANQVLKTQDPEIVELFDQLVRRLIQKSKKKQKTNDVLFSALYLVTKTVVIRLEKDSESQNTSTEISWKLGKMLNLFLDNDRIPENHCSRLLVLIEPLLLHENQQIVVNTVYLFRRHNTSTGSIRQSLFNNVAKNLKALNFKAKLNEKFTLKDSFKPKWMEVTGSTFDERTCSASLIILTPTMNCVSKGDIDEYVKKADKNETDKYLNALKVLHHLHRNSTQRNIIQLFAFQRRPIPIFYVTEKAGNPDFLSYLLDCRTSKGHVLNRQQQLKYAVDVMNAVLYLHDKKVIHRNLTCSAFSIREESQTLFLHDFSIATRVLTENGIISDLEEIGIPVLWSAPVSILEDRYDRRTDAWMLGNVIYELFTYGCHPYTEVYNTPTEQILEYVLFSDLKLHKWPCIPAEVHALIQGLTKSNPSESLDISAVKTKLELMLQFEKENSQDRNPDFAIDAIPPQDLPQLDVNQRMPETEIPYLIQQMKCNHGRSISSAKHVYLNTRLSQRLHRGSLAITPIDITPQDKPRIVKRFNFLDVREAVTLKFLRFLPNIDNKEIYRDLLCLLNSPQKHVTQARQKLPENMFPFFLKYRCIRGASILELAFANVFGDPETERDKYMQIVLKIVSFVQEVHRRRCILGDICAEYIYISEYYDKVFMPRLGRMMYYEDQARECLTGPIYSDRKRWNPIEVLQHGQYSFESDIYRLAMTVYEFYTALDIHKRDPMADHLTCSPFGHIPYKDLADALYNGSVPQKPKLCPDWLYRILLKCWDRDRTLRPSALWIKEIITRQLGDPLTDIDHSLFTMQLDAEVTETPQPEEIPHNSLNIEKDGKKSEIFPIEGDGSHDASNFILSRKPNAKGRSRQRFMSPQMVSLTPSHNAWPVTSSPLAPNFVNTNNTSSGLSIYENTSDFRFEGANSASFDGVGKTDRLFQIQSSPHLNRESNFGSRVWNPNTDTLINSTTERKFMSPIEYPRKVIKAKSWDTSLSIQATGSRSETINTSQPLNSNPTSRDQYKTCVLGELQRRISRGMYERENRQTANISYHHMTGGDNEEEFV